VTHNIAVLHESFVLKSLLPKLHENNEKETRNIPIIMILNYLSIYYISENNNEALNGGIHIVASHYKIRYSLNTLSICDQII